MYSAILDKTHRRDYGFIVLKYRIIKILIGFLHASCNKTELCRLIIYKSLSLKLFKKRIVEIVDKKLVKIVILLFFKF